MDLSCYLKNIFNAGACAISLADIHRVHDNESFLLCQPEKMISDKICPTTYGNISILFSTC